MPERATDTPLDVRAIGGLAVGARVRLTGRQGALAPEETGHDKSIAYGAGQIGTLVRFVHRHVAATGIITASDHDIAIVRWDAQSWHEWDIPFRQMTQGKAYDSAAINALNDSQSYPTAKLESFECEAGLSYLTPAE